MKGTRIGTEGEYFGLIKHVHTEKGHAREVWRRKEGGGVACWTQNLCSTLHMHFSYLDSSPSLSISIRTTVVCVSCIWADTGNQVLCVSINYPPRERTHLELKQYHKLFRISDLLQVSLQDSSSQDRSFQMWPWEERISVSDVKGKALKTIYALLGWVSQDTN